jgi:pyrophosphate--fructose-6-phosphate 1-phosphotransferase
MQKRTMANISPLTKARSKYKPKLPKVLDSHGMKIKARAGNPTKAVANAADIRKLFPNVYGGPVLTFQSDTKVKLKRKNVGVVLSGGQAPGGHNVIAGIFDGIKAANKGSKLYGFLGGPSGITDGKYVNLTSPIINKFRNTGGFDIIGSGRTKLETIEQFEAARATLEMLDINALVIVGGDDSNTNAALAAEYFKAHDTGIQVIGVPKTIDGDLKNDQVETSFGFDTASKTYSELVGNICRDANSARKYWHFIKLMGRSASHITLEVALQTNPNLAIISEEVAEKKMTLAQVVDKIIKLIIDRARRGKDFGIICIPEGLIEFIPEVKKLISELNDILVENDAYFKTLNTFDDQAQFINSHLSKSSSYVFSSLPMMIQAQLLMDRDPHGNVQVSRIETDKLLIDVVGDRLREMKTARKYKGKFSAQSHFLGYEGRCAAPTNFDADYCYSLGYTAAALIQAGVTGYMSCVKNLSAPAGRWIPGGVPLTMMMNMERRHGKSKPVIRKALVSTKGNPFKELAKRRKDCGTNELYLAAGPIQYFGPPAVCDQPSITLKLEQKGKKKK